MDLPRLPRVRKLSCKLAGFVVSQNVVKLFQSGNPPQQPGSGSGGSSGGSYDGFSNSSGDSSAPNSPILEEGDSIYCKVLTILPGEDVFRKLAEYTRPAQVISGCGIFSKVTLNTLQREYAGELHIASMVGLTGPDGVFVNVALTHPNGSISGGRMSNSGIASSDIRIVLADLPGLTGPAVLTPTVFVQQPLIHHDIENMELDYAADQRGLTAPVVIRPTTIFRQQPLIHHAIEDMEVDAAGLPGAAAGQLGVVQPDVVLGLEDVDQLGLPAAVGQFDLSDPAFWGDTNKVAAEDGEKLIDAEDGEGLPDLDDIPLYFHEDKSHCHGPGF